MAVFASDTPDVHLSRSKSFTKHTAGAELNVATGVARLGLDAFYASAVGNDAFGNYLIEEAQNASIHTDYFKKMDGEQTGIYFKENVTKGDPEVLYYRKNSAISRASLNDIFGNLENVKDALKNVSILHVTGIYAAISENAREQLDILMDLARENDTLITFDPNIRRQLWASDEEMITTLNHFAAKADIVLPGVNEGETLCQTTNSSEIADFYFGLPGSRVCKVVVKLGEEGAYYKVRTGETGNVQGYPVDMVVDTVGAGDGFAVGLISALMDGENFEKAVHRACIIGALAVTKPGDSEGYPTRAKLDKA